MQFKYFFRLFAGLILSALFFTQLSFNFKIQAKESDVPVSSLEIEQQNLIYDLDGKKLYDPRRLISKDIFDPRQKEISSYLDLDKYGVVANFSEDTLNKGFVLSIAFPENGQNLLNAATKNLFLPQSSSEQVVDNLQKLGNTSVLSPMSTASSWKLPFAVNENWQINSDYGWHYDYYTDSYNALDIIPNLSTYKVVAPIDSVVESSCNAGNNHMAIRLRSATGQVYSLIHVNSSSIFNGKVLRQGEQIGVVANDLPANNCALSTGIHLHFGMPTRPFTIDGYTFGTDQLYSGQNLASSQGNTISTPPETTTFLNDSPESALYQNRLWQLRANQGRASYRNFNAQTNTQTNWQPFPGDPLLRTVPKFASSPVDNTLEVYLIDSYGAILSSKNTSSLGNWSGYSRPFSGITASRINLLDTETGTFAAITTPDQLIKLYFRDKNQNNWTFLNNLNVSPSESIELFYDSPRQNLWISFSDQNSLLRTFSRSSSGVINELNMNSAGSKNKPSLVYFDNQIYLAMTGTDEKIYYRTSDGANLTSWQAITSANSLYSPVFTLLGPKLNLLFIDKQQAVASTQLSDFGVFGAFQKIGTTTNITKNNLKVQNYSGRTYILASSASSSDLLLSRNNSLTDWSPWTNTSFGSSVISAQIYSPASNQTYTAPATISVGVQTSVTAGFIAKVEVYSGSTLLGSDNTSPYTVDLIDAKAGNYQFVARVYDSEGNFFDTAPVTASVIVPDNLPPQIQIVTPSSGQTFGVGEKINLKANVSDPDGGVERVEIYEGENKIGQIKQPPFNYILFPKNTSGTYAYTMIAYDQGGLATTSNTVEVNVVSSKKYSGWIPTGNTLGILDNRALPLGSTIFLSRNKSGSTNVELRSFDTDSQTQSSWQQSGAITTKEPTSLVAWNSGLVESAWGTDNRLYTRFYQNGIWSPWDEGRGITLKQTPLSFAGSNSLIQTAWGSDNRLYFREYINGTWGTWKEGSGITLSATPRILSSGGQDWLIATGSDSHVYVRQLNSTNWQRLTNSPLTQMTLGVSGNNLMLTSRSGNRITNQIWQLSNSTWNLINSDTTGAGITVAQTPLNFGENGDFTQLARGSDQVFYQRTFQSGSWGTWENGGNITLNGEVVQFKVLGQNWQAAKGSDNQIWLRYRL